MPKNYNTKKVKISLIGEKGKMGSIITALARQDPEVEVSDPADVIIDFSSPEGTKSAIAMQKPLICGTTGLSEETMEAILSLSKKVPVLYSPNFSVGMFLCFEILAFLKDKRKYFSTISIEETHHEQKKDTPSGTAKKMADILGDCEIVSHRTQDAIGIHQVNFFLGGEKISLSHEVFSREAFAQGVLRAVKFIYNRPPNFYSLQDLFA